VQQVLIEVWVDVLLVIVTRIHDPLVVADFLALVVRMIDICASLEPLALIQSVLGVQLAAHCGRLIEDHVNLVHLEYGKVRLVLPIAVVLALF
jgi:hypothetical protein